MEVPKTTLDSESADKRLKLAVGVKDKKEAASAYKKLPSLYHSVEEYQQSQNYGENCERISMELSDQVLEEKAKLASFHYELKNYKQCKQLGKDLLLISEILGIEKRQAQAYESLAKSNSKTGNVGKSRKYTKRLPSISKELGNKEQEAEACEVLPKSYCNEGNDEESRKYAKKIATH